MSSPQPVDVVVIGAGQAGLSAGHHLRRAGFRPLVTNKTGDGSASRNKTGDGSASCGDAGAGTFVILDANPGPGGAWQHRWRTLLMATVNHIYDLPGMHQPPVDPATPSVDALPPYFAAFEAANDLQVRRPVRVTAVRRVASTSSASDGTSSASDERLIVEASTGSASASTGSASDSTGAAGEGLSFAARWVINATGTWENPWWPSYPGAESFAGRQLHVHDYVSADEFAYQTVVIVGGGISAVQLLNEISQVTDTFWVTRSEPVWEDGEFDEGKRIAAIDGVVERARRGDGPVSIISVTGMYWTPWAIEARDRGVLIRHPMFERIEPDGVRMPGGAFQPADVILWATGFHPALAHLDPLGLKTPAGGIRVEASRAIDEPRLFLIGYGPSQSTVGANRAGREAVRAIVAERSGAAGGEPPAAPSV